MLFVLAPLPPQFQQGRRFSSNLSPRRCFWTRERWGAELCRGARSWAPWFCELPSALMTPFPRSSYKYRFSTQNWQVPSLVAGGSMRAAFGGPGGQRASLLAGPHPAKGCFAASVSLGGGGGHQAQPCNGGSDLS